ncbi:SGNH/GDSL hydrolase family protein [Amycolatopsis magusensis]|uniref:SGNH/GDSL hydrolase family protein n=1 Tax=Amycolatopsis magusensis TaxID=882444 RepID=UPI0024A95BC3|nr:SGNH/GDSL hydrolase family protein [Amycolatopsis magusensis]MDI5978230.1 SGNH/GDSL hydrolase family protein [Amycolatopsis magusensis]
MKTTTRRKRGLLAAAVAVVCAGAAVPAAAQEPGRAEPVSTVFIGDFYTANFGITPIHGTDDPNKLFCFRSEENYPAVTARRLAEQGRALDIASDRSCGGALIRHFWEKQPLQAGLAAPPQKEALGEETRLVVGSVGGNTVGFVNILKQCSQQLRDQGEILPGAPVDADEPADRCGAFFTAGNGEDWLDWQFAEAERELGDLLDDIGYLSPDATVVLVGYPRIVPANVAKCQTPAPGQAEKPLADIPTDALMMFDKVQKRLNDLMRTQAEQGGAEFVDLYAVTGGNTACDGNDRGIGGLFENSQIEFFGGTLPWFLHPNTRGRDIQAHHVATAIRNALSA